MYGTTIGGIMEDTRSLDHGSHVIEIINLSRLAWVEPNSAVGGLGNS